MWHGMMLRQGTASRPEDLDAVLAKLGCYVLLGCLPTQGILEAIEALADLYTYYSGPPALPPVHPVRYFLPADPGPKTTTRQFVFDEE